MEAKEHKKHRKKHSGPKAEKKKKRYLQDLQLGDEEDARKRNPKAFAVQSAVRMARSFHRSVYLGLVVLPFHEVLGVSLRWYLALRVYLRSEGHRHTIVLSLMF